MDQLTTEAALNDKYSPALITGSNGQVGRAIAKALCTEGIATTRDNINLAEHENIIAQISPFAPKAIINAAAYTAVDKAEEEKELANIINAISVGKLAEYAFSKNIPFIHYSTDYVFRGDDNNQWNENDIPAPKNAYGRTKLAGEQAIIEAAKKYNNPKYLIFRTSWVYDEQGNNFVNTMLRLGKDREVLSVINDQIGAPTYAGDIAKYTIEALNKAADMNEFPSGIYHMCGGGETNWHKFAEEIFRKALELGADLEVKEVREIPTSEYPTPASRPLNSRMDMSKLKKIFDIIMPNWKDALNRCLNKKLELEKEALL